MSTEPEPTPPQPDQQPFARAMDGNYLSCDYPEDAAHENGNYATKCRCGTVFIGHKRRMLCKVCAETPQPEPEPPTDTERAHAFEWLRKLGLEGTTQEARLAYVAMQTMLRSAPPQPEPQQSAVEWVSGLLCDGTDLEGNDLAFLLEDNALELAERCDAWREHSERLAKMLAKTLIERSKAQNQLAASQAEAAEMRKQRDLAGKQVLTLTTEINRLRKGITEIKAGTRIGWFMVDLGVKCSKLLNE